MVSNSAGNYGAGVCSSLGSSPSIGNTIIAFSQQSEAVACTTESYTIVTSSDIYGNAGGDWTGCLVDQNGTNGNMAEDPLFCDVGSFDFHLDAGSPCAEGNNPIYGQIGALPVGCGLTSVPGEEVSHKGPRLYPSTPNPFNPMTSIKYDLPTQAHVSLRIFDMSGRLIRVLVAGRAIEAGTHEAVWNGQDETGRTVAAGVYFYRLQVGGYTQTKRMTLVK